MKIYDISQEVFSSKVWPGDPSPERMVVSSINEGDICNVTAFSMCTHNGTHIDAPCHFIKDGVSVEKVSLEKTVGEAYVADTSGFLSREMAEDILSKARAISSDAAKRILLKGNCIVTPEAATVFADYGVCLVGNESQTVGDPKSPLKVHMILLSNEVVLLEGVRLSHIPEGAYFLAAQPLNLEGSDGSPCRAILIDFNV